MRTREVCSVFGLPLFFCCCSWLYWAIRIRGQTRSLVGSSRFFLCCSCRLLPYILWQGSNRGKRVRSKCKAHVLATECVCWGLYQNQQVPASKDKTGLLEWSLAHPLSTLFCAQPEKFTLYHNGGCRSNREKGSTNFAQHAARIIKKLFILIDSMRPLVSRTYILAIK